MSSTPTATARRVLAGLVALGAMAAFAPASPLLAQDVVTTRESCRCVDRDGNQIENCSCFRNIGPEAFNIRVLPFGQSRPRIGVTVDVGQDAEDDARGAMVTSILEDGPAAEAGIEVGDIIVSVDGHSLFDPLDDDVEDDFDLDGSIPVQRLLAIARELEAGDEVEIEYLRGDDLRVAMVEADDLPGWGISTFVSPNWDADALAQRMRELGDRVRSGEGGAYLFRRGEGEGGINLELRQPDVAFFRNRTGDAPNVRLRQLDRPGDALVWSLQDGWMFNECPASEESGNLHFSFGTNCLGGLELLALSPGLAGYFGVDQGVLVTDVHEESPTGLEAGDVILSIGDRPVTSPERARRILSSYTEGEEVTFRILRHGNEMSVRGGLAG